MTGVSMTFRDLSISFQSKRRAKPMREVWASYVRNRWPKNTLGSIMQEFDLTEGEARNLLYSHGSQNTFDKCGAHKNGGPLLELDLLMHRWQTSLTEIAQEKERRQAHERERQEARIQSERLALSRLASLETTQAEAVAAPPGGAP